MKQRGIVKKYFRLNSQNIKKLCQTLKTFQIRPHTAEVPLELLDRFSSESSIHGVKYFGERKRHLLEKTFWVATFVISVSLCIQNIMEIHKKRSERPVMISFAKGLSPTYEIPFPAVTICPESKANVHDIDVLKAFREKDKNLSTEKLASLSALNQVCDFMDHNYVSDVLNGTDPEPDIVPTLQSLAIPFDEMFGRCRYGSRAFTDCKKYFSKVITDEGVCWTFNMLDQTDLLYEKMDQSLRLPEHGRTSDWFLEKYYNSHKLKVFPRRVIGSGIPSGLTVELKMKKSNINAGCKHGNQAFRFALHSPVEIPHLSKQFFSISFDKQTTISAVPHMIYSSKDVRDYEPTSRQCYFNDERKLKFFKIYTKSSCELECLADQMLASCGCVKFSLPRDNDTKVCNNSHLECIYQTELNYTVREFKWMILNKQIKKDKKHGKSKEAHEKIERLRNMESCGCLPSCTSLRYDAELSQSDYTEGEDSEYRTSSINVYFKLAHFTRLKRYEINGFSDFLSSTGGIFGLFMGCSMLSFIEIIYHMIAYSVRRVMQKIDIIRKSSVIKRGADKREIERLFPEAKHLRLRRNSTEVSLPQRNTICI